MCLQFTGFISTYGAGCLLSASRLAVIVRFQFAGLVTTYGASSFLGAGRFTVVVSVSLAVSRVTGGANSCLGAGGGAACAIFTFLVSIVMRANSCVRTVTVGCPSAKGVCSIGGDGQLTLCFNVLFLVKESGTN